MADASLTPQQNTVDQKSPKLPSKKVVVKQLVKQSDGTFVASAVAPEPVPSPRTYRANRTQALDQKVPNILGSITTIFKIIVLSNI